MLDDGKFSRLQRRNISHLVNDLSRSDASLQGAALPLFDTPVVLDFRNKKYGKLTTREIKTLPMDKEEGRSILTDESLVAYYIERHVFTQNPFILPQIQQVPLARRSSCNLLSSHQVQKYVIKAF